MNYWLVKSEPSVWSWDQQVAKGAKGEAWTGVRNFTARQNLVNMRRILRKIAEDEPSSLGDTSTLADPAVVDDLVQNRQNKKGAPA